MSWHGPYRVEDLLAESGRGETGVPETSKGAYLVTKHKWVGTPTAKADPLYAGGLTSENGCLRIRIGALLIDSLGFFRTRTAGRGKKTGVSSGGQSIHRYCVANGLDPMDLWVGWSTGSACQRCAEIAIYDALAPRLNRRRPPACERHRRLAQPRTRAERR